MSNVLIDDSTMTDIADAIREKTETEDTYLPSEMPAAVRSIQGGAKPIELTKAEYDALPDDKLTDNKMYLLTDYAEKGGGGGASTNYSTEEQVIGTWIDGKPLYQKTIPGITQPGVVINGEIDSLIQTFGYYVRGDNNTRYIYDGSMGVFRKGGNEDNLVVFEKKSSFTYTFNLTIVIQYTKTTD